MRPPDPGRAAAPADGTEADEREHLTRELDHQPASPVQTHPCRACWPCSTCGTPGVRNLGTRGYCAVHAADLLALVSPEAWAEAGGGVGLPGVARPDHGEGWYELTCSCCGAGWVSVPFARCPWCVDYLDQLERWQAEQLLDPPDVDPAARDYEARMRAWAGRLARGVEAGLIGRDRALAAWRRAVANVAA